MVGWLAGVALVQGRTVVLGLKENQWRQVRGGRERREKRDADV